MTEDRATERKLDSTNKETVTVDSKSQVYAGQLTEPLTLDIVNGSQVDGRWLLIEEGFDKAREHEIESFFTVANGYIGTRGSLPEDEVLALPETFVAGIYATPPNEVPDIVVAPDWSEMIVCIAGQEVCLEPENTIEHRRTLHMNRGLLERYWRYRDGEGRITELRYWRFASLADRHLLVESLTLTPENHSSPIAVESNIDAEIATRLGVPPLHVRLWKPRGISSGEGSDEPSDQTVPVMVARALDSKVDIAIASRTVFQATRPTMAHRTILREEGLVGELWEWDAEIGVTYRLDKIVAIYDNHEVRQPAKAAVAKLHTALRRGADALLRDHEREWHQRWQKSGVTVAGDPKTQLAIDFAVYHLVSSANPETEFASIGARGLTGEVYKGHVFWDTEIFMLPFFIYTYPEAARALLMYRYRTLPAARRKAAEMGYRGALYPWESAENGEEATPPAAISPEGELIPILSRSQEHHISADVGYAILRYWQVTGDDDFFLRAGVEMMVEISRFWASRVTKGEDGLYHINGVIGPDEYHETVDDNAYTNNLAKWILERGAETVRLLRERWPTRWRKLSKSLQLDPLEAKEWLRIAATMYTGFNPETNLFEQFRGYFDLEEIDLAEYEPRTAPMDVLLGHRRIAQTQVTKQPDVVMLIYLLWDQFAPEVREANFDYYVQRCATGSSLAPAIDALVAARLNKTGLAEQFLRQAEEIDLANNMGNAAGGVHIGAQGGLWQALVLGFGGAQVEGGDRLILDPHPLPFWRCLSFSLQLGGRNLEIIITPSPLTVEVGFEKGAPLVVLAGEREKARVAAAAGKRYRASLSEGKWQHWEEVP